MQGAHRRSDGDTLRKRRFYGPQPSWHVWRFLIRIAVPGGRVFSEDSCQLGSLKPYGRLVASIVRMLAAQHLSQRLVDRSRTLVATTWSFT
mmetsp:Transcript_148674/g.477417  ORF Transcript_148674/g.477417 Transcript_148674/m.477417 type:complete len:91 (+) Transcript_148674:473-745(+)